MKKLIFSAALVMGLASLSFAGTPKSETPSTSNAKDADLYYFPISADGSSFTSRTVPTSQTSPECDGIQDDYCDVGLTADQVDLVGGNAQVKMSISTPPSTNRTHKE